MDRQVTMTLSEELYESIARAAGDDDVAPYLERLAKRAIDESTIAAGYREMAADADREREADEWCEALIGDVADAPW